MNKMHIDISVLGKKGKINFKKVKIKKKINLHPKLELYLHKGIPSSDDSWIVTEIKSGSRFAGGHTQIQAIKNAEAIFTKYGIIKILDSVKRMVKKVSANKEN